jgi:hypothetical protein
MNNFSIYEIPLDLPFIAVGSVFMHAVIHMETICVFGIVDVNHED